MSSNEPGTSEGGRAAPAEDTTASTRSGTGWRGILRPTSVVAPDWLVWTLLAVASGIVLYAARGYLAPFTPLGDDASSHITTIATLAEAIASGEPWWSNDYNGGFPLGLYYQPLPHVASAIVCAMLGGHDAAPVTYKLLLTLMLAVQPWAIYAGLRRAGLGRIEAAAAGFCGPFVLDGIDFGYHAKASLTVGLYTQAWGNVALPLAFGELAAIGRGEGRVGRAILACAFVASTHMFFAIALVVPALLFAIGGLRWRRSAWQLPTAGVGTFIVLAPWLIPLSLTQAYFGGWPFGRDTRVNGYGWEVVFEKIRSGALLDADATPVLSVAFAAGALVSLWGLFGARTAGRRAAAAFSLTLLGWAMVGYAGRAGVGPWIDRLNPLHANVQLFRYGSLLQFAALVLAGVGIGAVVRLSWRLGGRVLSVIAIVAIGLLPARAGLGQLETGFRTVDDARSFRPEAYFPAAEWLQNNAEGGRMYIGKRSGLRGHYHSGLMAWAADRPGAQSYGVGLHDSLHFYTLEYLHPDSRGALALADLYDFRIIVHSPRADLSGLGDLEELYNRSGYVVSRLDVSGHSVEPMREAETQTGTPRGARRDIRAWFRGNGPESRQTVALEVEDHRSREGLLGHPPAPRQAMQFPNAGPVGETLSSTQDGGRFEAHVRLDEPGLIVAKVGYHPFWRVRLNGERVDTVFAFPGFVAVRAPAGEHAVEGVFRWPTYSRVLLLASPLPLVLAFGWSAFGLSRRRGTTTAS